MLFLTVYNTPSSLDSVVINKGVFVVIGSECWKITDTTCVREEEQEVVFKKVRSLFRI
jgi:hypothetical protein